MLNWFLRHGSHAVEPVLRNKPIHSAKECVYCAQKLKNQVNHIRVEIPLEYQNLSETNVTRFGFIVSAHSEPSHSAHGKTMYDVLKNGLQCRIVRKLDIHQPDKIQPTLENIKSELKHLVNVLKRNDRLIVYLDTDQAKDIIQFLFEMLEEKHIFVWIICAVSCVIPKTASKQRTCLVCANTDSHFTEKLLDVFNHTRYRTRVSDMSKDFSITSNYNMDPKHTYFGF